MSEPTERRSTASNTEGPARVEEEPEGAGGDDEAGAADDEAAVGDLPLDVVFDILKNRRRRLVLRYLLEVSETTSLSELSEHIASKENDKPVDALSSAERKRVYVGLYQGHLPRLDEANVVDFEDDRGTVTVGANIDQVTRRLEAGTEPQADRWPYYLSLSAIGGTVFVVQHLVLQSAVLSALVVGTILTVIAGLALVASEHE